jgi:hypothetical protein
MKSAIIVLCVFIALAAAKVNWVSQEEAPEPISKLPPTPENPPVPTAPAPAPEQEPPVYNTYEKNPYDYDEETPEEGSYEKETPKTYSDNNDEYYGEEPNTYETPKTNYSGEEENDYGNTYGTQSGKSTKYGVDQSNKKDDDDKVYGIDYDDNFGIDFDSEFDDSKQIDDEEEDNKGSAPTTTYTKAPTTSYTKAGQTQKKGKKHGKGNEKGFGEGFFTQHFPDRTAHHDEAQTVSNAPGYQTPKTNNHTYTKEEGGPSYQNAEGKKTKYDSYADDLGSQHEQYQKNLDDMEGKLENYAQTYPNSYLYDEIPAPEPSPPEPSPPPPPPPSTPPPPPPTTRSPPPPPSYAAEDVAEVEVPKETIAEPEPAPTKMEELKAPTSNWKLTILLPVLVVVAVIILIVAVSLAVFYHRRQKVVRIGGEEAVPQHTI